MLSQKVFQPIVTGLQTESHVRGGREKVIKNWELL